MTKEEGRNCDKHVGGEWSNQTNKREEEEMFFGGNENTLVLLLLRFRVAGLCVDSLRVTSSTPFPFFHSLLYNFLYHHSPHPAQFHVSYSPVASSYTLLDLPCRGKKRNWLPLKRG